LQNQLLCAWDTLIKLNNLVLQERIKLQKKNLEMKLNYVFLSQVSVRSKPIYLFQAMEDISKYKQG